MRKKFVYFVLIPIVICSIVVYLFIDRWIESGIELAGESITGAKVEIDHLSVSLSPIGIRWDHMQVADANDAWRNLFETGTVKFALNFGQLLRGKYIIESMEVNNFILGTRRTTDGSLPAPKHPSERTGTGGPTFVETASAALGKNIEESLPVNPAMFKAGLNVDSLVKALDIQTLKRIDTLRAQTLAASKQWDAVSADFEGSKKKLADVEAAVKAINPSQLKGVDNIMAAIATVDNAVKTVKEVSDTFDSRKASVEGDITKISGSVSTLNDVAKEDLRHLQSMAHLPDLNTMGIARLLIGKEMYDRALFYLHWIDVARAHIPKHGEQAKDPDPPRMKGQDIRFPEGRAYPKFWIQKILLSGGTDSASRTDFIRARGEVDNVTDDQSVTRVPLTVALEGSQAGARAMTLHALFDRTKDVPFDEYTASLTGVPIAEFPIGSPSFLPAKITNARMTSSVKVSVPGNAFDMNVSMTMTDMRVHFDGDPRNKIESIVRDVLASIARFTVTLRLWNTAGNVDMALATDLDDQIADKVKGVLGAEFTKLQNDLKSKLDATIAAKRKEFDDFYGKKKDAIEQQLSGVKGVLDKETASLDAKKKELTDRLTNEKKGALNKALKGILK